MERDLNSAVLDRSPLFDVAVPHVDNAAVDSGCFPHFVILVKSG